jgi:hypothetical protein
MSTTLSRITSPGVARMCLRHNNRLARALKRQTEVTAARAIGSLASMNAFSCGGDSRMIWKNLWSARSAASGLST